MSNHMHCTAACYRLRPAKVSDIISCKLMGHDDACHDDDTEQLYHMMSTGHRQRLYENTDRPR